MAQVSIDKIEKRIADLETEASDFIEQARGKTHYRDDGHAEHDAAMCRRFAAKVLRELIDNND